MGAIPDYNKSQEFYCYERLWAFIDAEYKVYHEEKHYIKNEYVSYRDCVDWYLMENGNAAYGLTLGHWSDRSKRGYAFLPKSVERQDD